MILKSEGVGMRRGLWGPNTCSKGYTKGVGYIGHLTSDLWKRRGRVLGHNSPIYDIFNTDKWPNRWRLFLPSSAHRVLFLKGGNFKCGEGLLEGEGRRILSMYFSGFHSIPAPLSLLPAGKENPAGLRNEFWNGNFRHNKQLIGFNPGNI